MMNKIIEYIETASLEDLQILKEHINIMIEVQISTVSNKFNVNDKVFIINQRSRKLPFGKVSGIIKKINPKRAKVDFGNYGIWNVHYSMLEKE